MENARLPFLKILKCYKYLWWPNMRQTDPMILINYTENFSHVKAHTKRRKWKKKIFPKAMHVQRWKSQKNISSSFSRFRLVFSLSLFNYFPLRHSMKRSLHELKSFIIHHRGLISHCKNYWPKMLLFHSWRSDTI